MASGAGTNFKVIGGTRSAAKVGGALIRRKRRKKFCSCPSTFFGSKHTISRFGERFCNGQYTVWSDSCLLFFYSRWRLVPSHLYKWGHVAPVPHGVGAVELVTGSNEYRTFAFLPPLSLFLRYLLNLRQMPFGIRHERYIPRFEVVQLSIINVALFITIFQWRRQGSFYGQGAESLPPSSYSLEIGRDIHHQANEANLPPSPRQPLFIPFFPLPFCSPYIPFPPFLSFPLPFLKSRKPLKIQL